MRILSGALPASDTFLHVGYISAYPRTMSMHELTRQTSTLLLEGTPVDVAQALRLKDEALPQAPSAQPTPTGAVGWPYSASTATVTFLVGFFLLLTALFRVRKCRSWKRALQIPLVMLLVIWTAHQGERLFGFFTAFASSLPPPNVAPPWQGVTPRAYADPEMATRVLMNGILSNALANARGSVSTLAQVKNEVGLPVPASRLTEGERYALQTYGLDGWGRPFGARGLASGDTKKKGGNTRNLMYGIVSAGPDGTFNTPDDLDASVSTATEFEWDSIPRTPFLYREGSQLYLVFHRWSGKNFRYVDRGRSKRLFDGTLYDSLPMIMPEHDLNISWDSKTMISQVFKAAGDAYDGIASKTPYTPLVLMLPRTKPAETPPQPEAG